MCMNREDTSKEKVLYFSTFSDSFSLFFEQWDFNFVLGPKVMH